MKIVRQIVYCWLLVGLVACGMGGSRIVTDSVQTPFLAYEGITLSDQDVAILKTSSQVQHREDNLIWWQDGTSVIIPSKNILARVDSVDGKRVLGNRYIHLLPGKEYEIQVYLSSWGTKCLGDKGTKELKDSEGGVQNWKLVNIGQRYSTDPIVKLRFKFEKGKSYIVEPNFNCPNWKTRMVQKAV